MSHDMIFKFKVIFIPTLIVRYQFLVKLPMRVKCKVQYIQPYSKHLLFS